MNSGGHWSTMDQTSYSTADEQYYDQGQDTNMVDVQHGDGESDVPKKKNRPWEKIGPDGRVIKKKPNPAKKNAIFRKALQPKSSIMCLNELHSGLKYVTEPVATIGNFSVSVEVNSQTFRGYGTTKDLAKQAAAEAALVSFVKAPPPKPAPGEAPNVEDDTTPWRTIASFAMYKLFSDWRDGKIGMSNSTGQQGFVPTMAGGMTGNMAMCMQNMQGFSMMQQQQASGIKDENKDETLTNVSLHLNRSLNSSANSVKQPVSVYDRLSMSSGMDQTSSTIPMDGDAKPEPRTPKAPKEVKLNTENQRTRHPVMILHQLCPVIKYESNELADPKRYVMSSLINEQQFTGEATTIKGAKFNLAKAALKGLYDIDNIFQLP